VAHTEPTPAEVGALRLLLAGLASAWQELGVQKMAHQWALKGHDAGETPADIVHKYEERLELAKLSAAAQWEAVDAWVAKHLPAGVVPPGHRHE